MNNTFSSFILCLSLMISTNSHATRFESNIPDFGQRAGVSLGVQEEKIIGNVMMQQLNGSDERIDDPVIDEYLRYLSGKITKGAPETLFHLEFFSVKSPAVNAFAFFGGHIAVHSGLILAVRSEDELAGVLAHETAHITQNHLARIVTTNKRLMPLTYAELLGALVIGVLGAPEAASHLANAALGGHVQQLINYTREHEQEADRIGVQILSRAGFDPNGLGDVLRTLSLSSRFQEKPPEYLLTHPAFESRIADVQNRALKLHKPEKQDSLFFELARARLELQLPENPKRKLARLQMKLYKETPGDTTAAEYAYALSLAKTRHYEEAIHRLQMLIHDNPDEWVIRLGLAETLEASNKTQEALQEMQALHEKHPDNHAIIISYAQILLNAKQGAAAKQLLLKNRRFMHEPLQQQLLAKAHSLVGNRVELHLAQAEYHHLRGEYKESLRDLDIGLEHAKENRYLLRKIKTRKQEYETLHQQEEKIKL